jgi:hypothetical protein
MKTSEERGARIAIAIVRGAQSCGQLANVSFESQLPLPQQLLVGKHTHPSGWHWSSMHASEHLPSHVPHSPGQVHLLSVASQMPLPQVAVQSVPHDDASPDSQILLPQQGFL